jgi:hypothetical protein
MVLQFGAGYGDVQSATVWISNPGGMEETVTARQFDWRTTRAGDFAMEPGGTEGRRSLLPFMRLVPAQFTLKPGESRQVQLLLRMPPSHSDVASVAWGGFLLQAFESGLAGGITPGATVVVYDNAAHATSKLTLAKFSAHAQRHTAEFYALLRNGIESYARPAVRISLTRGPATVRSTEIPVNAILPGDERTIHYAFPRVPKGRYRAQFVIDNSTDVIIEGETSVTIP